MNDISFHKLSWTDLEKDCLDLYHSQLTDIRLDRIVSICRGGDVVSRIFSDLFGCLPISHITLTSYKDMKKQKVPVITEEPQKDLTEKSILVVDEVSDTGETFKIVTEYFQKRGVKKIYTLSPYIKPHTTFVPDFHQKSIDAWIVFPYDVRETADGFSKTFGSKKHAGEKMLEIGFQEWELKNIID